MGTPWWTGETGESGVNPDFHNTSDNLVLRLVPGASGSSSSGILQEKNLCRYGREIEEIAFWINSIYPLLNLTTPTWYLYDSEANGRESGAGWEQETNDTIPPGTGFLTFRKEYTPVNTFNSISGLDDHIQNQFDDVQNALNIPGSATSHPSALGFYQRFTGDPSSFNGLPENLPSDAPAVPPSSNIDSIEGINYMRPKAAFAIAVNGEFGDVVEIYNLLGPMFSSPDGIDNDILDEENLLCRFNLRDENHNILTGITALDITPTAIGGRRIWAAFSDSTIRAFDISGQQISTYSIGSIATSIATMFNVRYNPTQDPMYFDNGTSTDDSEFALSNGHSVFFLTGSSLKALRLTTSANFIRVDDIQLEDIGGRFNFRVDNPFYAFPTSVVALDPDSDDTITDTLTFVAGGSRGLDSNRDTLLIGTADKILEPPTLAKNVNSSQTLGNAHVLQVDKSLDISTSKAVATETNFSSLRRYVYPNTATPPYRFTRDHYNLLLIDSNNLTVRTNQKETSTVSIKDYFRRSENEDTGLIQFTPPDPPFAGAPPVDLIVQQRFDLGGGDALIAEGRQLLTIDYSELIASGLPPADQEAPSIEDLTGVETFLTVDLFLSGDGGFTPFAVPPSGTTMPTTLNLDIYTGAFPLPTGGITDTEFFATGGSLASIPVSYDASESSAAGPRHFMVKIDPLATDLRSDGKLYILASASASLLTPGQSVGFRVFTILNTNFSSSFRDDNTLLGGAVV